MLKDWQTTTADTREAEAAIKAHAFDLLIIARPNHPKRQRTSSLYGMTCIPQRRVWSMDATLA